jgi:hypothetical protein
MIRMVRNVATLLLFGATVACMSQTTPPAPAAPPAVEAALRDRVNKFYQDQVDGKYRQAEQYVAEDTKDFYYGKYKAKYLKFAIVKISYSANFTKAKVGLQVEQELSQAMMPKMTVNLLEESNWKIEKDLWCWTYHQDATWSPFGESSPPGTQAAAPNVAVIQDLTEMVSADKKEVRLNQRETADRVVLQNSLPGFVILRLVVPEAPGLDVRLDHEQVGPKGMARVSFAYKPTADAVKEVVVRVVVQPTNQTIPIRVTMEPPDLPAN